MTKEAYEQMMAGLKEAEDEFRRIVFPDCTAKYYAVRDAIKLLKEQEVEPKTVLMRVDGNYCPYCSSITSRVMRVQRLFRGTRFCPYCGKAVKWE